MSLIERADYAFPLRIDPVSGRCAQSSYNDPVDQMVRQVLLTTPGERVDLPQFGCGLRALVFAPSSDALSATLKLRVSQGLSQWLAGIVNVLDVEVASGSAVPEPGSVVVTVTYTLIETQGVQASSVSLS